MEVGAEDPHIWLNPVLVKVQVQNIADAYSKVNPENGDYYQQNAANFISQLDDLDSQIRTGLSGCSRDFVAFHNAFSYFAAEYDLVQHTIIASTNPHGEPTARTLEKIIDESKELGIKTIFTEEGVDPRTSQVIADEIGGGVLVLSPLEVGDETGYIPRMTQNLENLKEALC